MCNNIEDNIYQYYWRNKLLILLVQVILYKVLGCNKLLILLVQVILCKVPVLGVLNRDKSLYPMFLPTSD